ncbi:lysophospholipid acyltransferase family protein [Planctomycetaceae bacterium SH139]
MNRYHMQFAPAVWKPCLRPRVVRWLRPLRLRHQYRAQQLVGIDLQGTDAVRQALRDGCGVMIMPNHPSHADPFSIYMAGDELQTPLHVMATWHVFHNKPRLTQWLLQSHGCFSVDREANDIGAFRTAIDLLSTRKEPLVIFPEGEIYHCNDRVTPFRDGAAAIAVAAARRAKRPVVCVPCAISYRYLSDPTDALQQLMGQLEASIHWKPQPQKPLEERIYRFAEALLALKEIEYFGVAQAGDLADRIRGFRAHILNDIETRYQLCGGNTASLPERVKAARRTIMEALSSGQEAANNEQAATNQRPANQQSAKQQAAANQATSQMENDLEDLFLVVQSFSYPGDYVLQRPSIERMAETLDKFEEDVLRQDTARIRGERNVKVQFAEPIEVVHDRKNKEQVSQLSRQVETAVQDMLVSMRGESVMI